jgi:hypothetical protein
MRGIRKGSEAIMKKKTKTTTKPIQYQSPQPQCTCLDSTDWKNCEYHMDERNHTLVSEKRYLELIELGKI